MSENAWALWGHREFLLELNNYRKSHDAVAAKVGKDSIHTLEGQRLKALTIAVWDRVPHNPGAPEFRMGNTLGEYSHWFRAKFLQQFRAFFRYSSRSKIIVYVWVNDLDTLRAYRSKTDAYLVFKKMLESGKVPDSWDQLMAESKKLS